MEGTLLYAQFFFIFVAGLIMGRITMAIQYAISKPTKKHGAADTRKEDKTHTSEADRHYTSGPASSIIKPLNTTDIKNKF